MKYCISGRQPYSVLKQADEIKVKHNDKGRIMDFVEKIPDKTIILDMPEFDADFATWHMYDEKFEGGFILGLSPSQVFSILGAIISVGLYLVLREKAKHNK